MPPLAAEVPAPAAPLPGPPGPAAGPAFGVVAEAPRLRRRRTLTAAAGAAAGCAVLAALVWRLDVGAALAALARISWLPLGTVVLLNIPATWLRAVRSRWLVDRLGHAVPLGRMTSTQLAGQALSWLTPGATGDLVRPYFWRRSDAVPIRDGVSAVFYERVVSFLLLCAVGVALGAFLVPVGGWMTALAASAVAGVALLSGLLVAARRSAWVHGRLSRRVREAITRLGTLIGSAEVAARFTAITLAIFVVSGIQIQLLAAGLGSAVPLWVGVAAYCLSQAAGSLSTLPFGLGVTDVVVVALLVAAGLDAPTAAATMLLTRVAVTLPLGLAGAAAYAVLGRQSRASSQAA